MCGRAYDPRFLFTWPNSKTAVMGPQQLAGVLSIVGRTAAEAAGQAVDEEKDAFLRKVVEEQIERESLASFNTARLYDDGIIDPRDSRTVLGIALSACHSAEVRGTQRLRRLPHVSAGFAMTQDPNIKPIRKLLIANRGEIARRVMRTCRAMGIATVAVFSEPDRGEPFVAEADEAVALGGATPAESYLRGDAILAAARATGADAIHPGYGFLSEDARFAALCEQAGICFVGPPARAIAAMGSKLEAKRVAARCDVPLLETREVDGAGASAARRGGAGSSGCRCW